MQYSLKELRARINLTQADVAKIVGVSEPTYCNWEKNPEIIKLKNAIKLAEIFKVSVSEIKIWFFLLNYLKIIQGKVLEINWWELYEE